MKLTDLVVNSGISEMSNSIIIETRDVVYFEEIFSFKSRIPSDLSCTSFAYDIPSSSSTPTTDFEPREEKELGLSYLSVKIYLPIL